MHSSTATELFVTGALPASGTFPSTSAYQHPNAFSSRNFANNPSLTLQDAAFSATSNGLLTVHDPLLQIKASQGSAPAALTFERLGSSVLSSSIPPQSSTYRSAQESAPHLLQPQFTLLPSSLGGAQQAPQVFASSLFTGSPASLERVLQRECSVIKHHQRPSSTQSAQTQLSDSQHSIHNYLSNASGTDFQDTSRQSSLSCSPVGDATQVSSGGPQQTAPQVSVELVQSYSSAVPSPSFPSVPTAKAKHCSTKQPSRSTKTPKPQSITPTVQTQSYSKTAQSQTSVIAGQAQIYSTAQLPSLLSVSQSQNYVSTQSQNVPSVSHAPVFSAVKVEKLPSLYKTLAFSGQSQAVTSDSQTLSFSSEQQVLSSVPNESYSGQTRDLPLDSQSQNYSSSHSQGLSAVSQSQASYSSHSEVLSVDGPSEIYSTGQTLTSPSLPFSSPHVQSLPTSSPSQNFLSLHSQSSQAQQSPSPLSQKFLPVVQSTFVLPSHSQALQTNRSSDTKSYIKRKSDPGVFQTSKQDDQFSMQDLQTLQQQTSLESSTQRLTDEEINAQDTTYKVSSVDSRYSQSVIRSNSRLEDQVVELTLQGPKKDEIMVSSVAQLTQQIGHVTNVISHDIKKAANLMQATQINVDAEEVNQQHSLLHKVHEAKVPEQQGQVISTAPQLHTQAIRHGHQLCLPSPQVLLESACDLQLLQQSIFQSGLGHTKAVAQVQHIGSPQQVTPQFLQVGDHMIQSNGGQSQQLHPLNSEVMKMNISESSKPLQQHLASKDHFGPPNHDSKSQFISLGSVSFPESILLNDERNILSNVDDILAATAAACGVIPSEFAKSASNEEIRSLENGNASKIPFQTIDIRHVTPSFSSSTLVGKPLSVNNISLNGGQITLNVTTSSPLQPKNMSLDQRHIETSDLHILTRVTPSELEKRKDQGLCPVNHQCITTKESEGKNNAHVDGGLSVKDTDVASNGRTLNEESATSLRDFAMENDNTVTENKSTFSLQPVSMQHLGDETGRKTEDESQNLSQEDLQKQKDKGQNQVKNSNDDDAQQKHLKRSGQCKRQNARGTEASLPYSSPVPENSHETYQHEEKMRQKIKEVEEKQPEVRTGFIASFLDFLKSGPRPQFSAPPARVPNRMRRPAPPIARAPCPPPFSKLQTAAAAAAAPEPLEAPCEHSSKRGKDPPVKNLAALPSFSSDEDSVGGNQDLQKSITSVLSTLDDGSEKKRKAGKG